MSKLNPYRSSLPTRDVAQDMIVTDGVARWKSNGRVPPGECLEKATQEGLQFDHDKTLAAAEQDNREVFAAYRRGRAAMTSERRAEEAFEMRAAFGAGTVVVDVITGERRKV